MNAAEWANLTIIILVSGALSTIPIHFAKQAWDKKHSQRPADRLRKELQDFEREMRE